MDDCEGIMVVYNGVWINTDENRRYEGGKTKGLLVSRNITLSELKKKICVIMKGEGADDNVELNYPTPMSQMGRTYISIEDDGDLEYFIKYNRAVIQSTVVPIIASIQSSSVEAVDNAIIRVQSNEEPGVQHQVGRQQECVNEENIGHKQGETVYNTIHVNDADRSICEGNEQRNIKRKHVRATSYNHRPQDIVYAKGLGGGDWNPEFKKGAVFPTKRALSLSITLAASRGDFQYRVVKSDTRRLSVMCWEANCPWHLNSCKIGDSLLFVITDYHGGHECDELGRSSTKRQCVKHLVCDAVKQKFKDPRSQFTPNDIVNDVQHRFNLNVSYHTAWRSRELAFQEIRGSPEESYGRLPAYCYELERRNPGTVTCIHTEGGNHFKYFFMALGQCIRGFNSTMRPVLAVDATFLKCKFKGVMFVATALDGNRQIYPVAFGIADLENEESWLWFFRKLAEVIVDDPKLVIVSDRKQEIATAFAKVFDRALHGLCYYHLQGNMKHKFKMKKYDHALYCFDRACKSYRMAEFDSHFRQITDPDVRKYVLDIGIMKWSRAHCAARRYNVMTTNIAESVNSMLRHGRLLPVQQLVEHIRSVLQRWFAERVAKAKKCTSQLCPKLGEHKLRKRKRVASGMTVVRLDQYVYHVTNGDTDGEVNLALKTCTCRKFDLEQLPCKHAVAVCRAMNFSVYRLASPLYTRDFWEAAYSEVIYPVHTEDKWETPAHVKDLVVMPPISKVMPGRRKKQRVLSH